MAITIIKEPSGIYPAFNDSFLEFTSDLAGNNKAEVIYTGINTEPFIYYPDSSGKYLVNLKEVAKSRLNSDFEDYIQKPLEWSKAFTGLKVDQEIIINVFSDSSNEQLIKTYNFYRGVKQVGESIFYNPFQILRSSENGIDYYLKYFEGFETFFDLLNIEENDQVEILNKYTGVSYQFISEENGSLRIWIDKGRGENWTFDNKLPLKEGLNVLDINVNDDFVCGIEVEKIENCKGVYLKWLNFEGSFSFWLFDRYTRDSISSNNIDYLNANKFENVGAIQSKFKSFGNSVEKQKRIRTRYRKEYLREIESLLASPFVQMWSNENQNLEGEWINVNIEDSFDFMNKKNNNELTLTLSLPEYNTITN